MIFLIVLILIGIASYLGFMFGKIHTCHQFGDYMAKKSPEHAQYWEEMKRGF